MLSQATVAQPALTLPSLFSGLDKPAIPGGMLYGRATWALANYVENFTAFAALDLASIALHRSGGVWPTVWILARVVYLPLYLFDVIYVRSLVWDVSFAAILVMLVRQGE